MVCCDGGADEYIRRGHTPDVIIGDGDSLSEDVYKRQGLKYLKTTVVAMYSYLILVVTTVVSLTLGQDRFS